MLRLELVREADCFHFLDVIAHLAGAVEKDDEGPFLRFILAVAGRGIEEIVVLISERGLFFEMLGFLRGSGFLGDGEIAEEEERKEEGAEVHGKKSDRERKCDIRDNRPALLSKAFTKENDDLAEETPARFACPPGTRHFLTPDGAARLREEGERLQEERRHWLEKPAGLSREHRLGRIDQRLRELAQCLENAEVILPPAGSRREAQFGAVVTVRDGEGGEYQYRLVGAPEVDLERGWVSTVSPIARALMGKRAGEKAVLQTPEGARKLAILNVSYPE